MRNSSAIENLLYSSKNTIVVEEELKQFSDILKLVVGAHEKYKQCLQDEQIKNSDKWLDEVDERVFNFKRKVYSWLKKTNEDNIFKSFIKNK